MNKNVLALIVFCCVFQHHGMKASEIPNETQQQLSVNESFDEFDEFDDLADRAYEKGVISDQTEFKKFSPLQLALLKVVKPLLPAYLFVATKYRVVKNWFHALFIRLFYTRSQNDKA